jgi:predicted RNA-binding protein with PUA-like domain
VAVDLKISDPGMKKVTDYLPSRHWLMKTEPNVFSFDDLMQSPSQTTFWEGVRNYQARNFMVNEMTVGDRVLFYHSNAKPSGIVGLAEVVAPAQIDLTALDLGSEYFDSRSTSENPRWYAVSVGRPVRFARFLSLDELKRNPDLEEMLVLRKGQRLSILPISEQEFITIVQLGQG